MVGKVNCSKLNFQKASSRNNYFLKSFKVRSRQKSATVSSDSRQDTFNGFNYRMVIESGFNFLDDNTLVSLDLDFTIIRSNYG